MCHVNDGDNLWGTFCTLWGNEKNSGMGDVMEVKHLLKVFTQQRWITVEQGNSPLPTHV